LKYVYTGNVMDRERQSTFCPICRNLLIARDQYDVGEFHIRAGKCEFCEKPVPGHFEDEPGQWGTRRMPVDPSSLLRQMEFDKLKKQHC